MAKRLEKQFKVVAAGGQATPAPPIGPALGQHGVNIGQFVSQFNEATKDAGGMPIPVEITDDCDGCGYCVQQFECPALILDETEDCVQIDTMSCTQCGVCISVCPKGSIQKES